MGVWGGVLMYYYDWCLWYTACKLDLVSMRRPDNLLPICHFKNLASILEEGIYCRDSAPVDSVFISDCSVMRRRVGKVVTNNIKLPEYVNLYFWVRNAMLPRLMSNDLRDDIVVLSINCSILDRDGVYVSDRNAATSDVVFFQCRRRVAEFFLLPVFKKESLDR